MTRENLWTKYPTVYHMAALGSWPTIARHGLLSTSALLDRFEVTGPEREALEARRRDRPVTLTHPVHGSALLRDNGPMNDGMLVRCLDDGTSPADWYRLLNGRTFFWVDQSRLRRFREAKGHRASRQTVIYADTRRLVERHGDSILLTHMNTGATRSVKHLRGRYTFQPIEAYTRRRVVELTIPYAVPDLTDFVVRVEEAGCGAPARLVWER